MRTLRNLLTTVARWMHRFDMVLNATAADAPYSQRDEVELLKARVVSLEQAGARP
ncbi:hypothetical protein [Litoreibacter roseus]|uniref:Uncharacterized protein n=1 Tax=Litoreibacter roseus TaxID=2601869 RepID=A0A6N6JKC0_9RHOB|nr:hypothetical protein [Litoreibacter roseus]GFE65879.1 hypothetical protein KIN_29530 [Litoreibacter roseus]